MNFKSVLLLFMVLLIRLNAQQSFEDFLQQDQAAQEAFTQEFLNEYNAYIEADQAAFEAFKDEVEGLWGDFRESSRKDWVEYSEDKTWRSEVDFEKGEARVEVLVTPDEAQNPEIVREKLSEAVENTVLNKGKTKDYAIADEKPEALSPEPVLNNQLKTEDDKPVTSANAGQFAKDRTAPEKQVRNEIRGDDGKKRVAVSVSFSLVPNHVQLRAKKYEQEVKKYAAKYDLDPALIYAVIQTESSFNPKAKSHIPAFGLMQIVPKYAGRDAYKFVYRKDRVLQANYLYVPRQNIELGAAYLHILKTRYFYKLKDQISRTYCMIAAYNTGAGNVSRAFNGSTNIRRAIPEIDALNSDQVYRTMKRKLPYDETKNYLDKVTERMKLYRSS